MTRNELYILLSLVDGPKHGYLIMQLCKENSNGELKMGPGTLYGTVDKLINRSLIKTSGHETVNGRRRIYYALTKAGGLAVKKEIKNYENVINLSRKLSII